MAIVASALALFVAVPAFADHPFFGRSTPDWRSRASASCGGPRFGHRPSRVAHYSQLEYERGYERGHRRGSRVGYRDGFNGRRFCGAPTRKFGHASRFFVKGYLEAYGDAYRQGFRRGRADCGARTHHRH